MVTKIKVRAPKTGARIASTGGACIRLAPNEERLIPYQRAPMYSRAGCFLIGEPITPDSVGEAAREEAIKAALTQMIDIGDPNDFTSTGEPRVRRVEELSGIEVNKNEVAQVYSGLMS